jgi:hypothetical protein
MSSLLSPCGLSSHGSYSKLMDLSRSIFNGGFGCFCTAMHLVYDSMQRAVLSTQFRSRLGHSQVLIITVSALLSLSYTISRDEYSGCCCCLGRILNGIGIVSGMK